MHDSALSWDFRVRIRVRVLVKVLVWFIAWLELGVSVRVAAVVSCPIVLLLLFPQRMVAHLLLRTLICKSLFPSCHCFRRMG